MRIAIAGGTGVVGSYAADAAEDAGHDVVVLARAGGVNVQTGDGLAAALDGVEVVVDALNLATYKRSSAERFFVTTSRHLQDAGNRAGVRHIVSLSIVGIDRVPTYGYDVAKLAQEAAVTQGPVPVTILRATQFHEFPAQIMRATRRGPIAIVPRITSQPVAARTVGAHLVTLATKQPGGTHELAGPEVHDIADLAKRIVRHRNLSLKVLAMPVPGKTGSRMRAGALLATEATTIDGPTFDDWLTSADAERIEL